MKKEKIKIKMKGKAKGKAIIGIALAAIMLASVFAAMAPMGSAEPFPPESYSGLYNYITLANNPPATPVLIGQDIWLQGDTNASATIQGDPASGIVAGENFTADPQGKFDTSVMTKAGIYYVNPIISGTTVTSWEAKLAVTNPTMILDLKVSGTSVSSITPGTMLEVDFTNNLGASDMVSLVITDPGGNTIKVANGQYFDRINVSYLTSQYGAGTGINTTGWDLGTYKFKVMTEKNATMGRGARGLEKESNEKTLTIKTGEISISVEKTSAVELDSIKLTVTGVPGRSITMRTSDATHTTFPGGINDNPGTDTFGFSDTIDADGKRVYTVYFNDTGLYAITVTDTATWETDTVYITVTEKAVIFDVPTTVDIGEKLTIKGTSNIGDWVQIAADDIICSELRKLVIDENGEFEKEIDTTLACSGAFSDPGCVRLKAFIDTPYSSGSDVSGRTGDGSAKVFMLNNAGGGIDISASKVNIDKNETIILTIGAMPGHNVSVTTADQAHTVFEYNRYDFTGTSNNIINMAPADTISIPSNIGDCDSQADAMNIHGVWKTMDGDGVRKFEAHFTDIGIYKIIATDYGTAYPTATRLDEEEIEITISEKNVTFDIPSIVAIGEILTIKGTSNTGDWVQIAVEDYICTELKKLVIDENGEFEKEIDTSYACSGAFSVPGYVRLKAFIDTSYASWQYVSAYTDDGSTKVFMVRPWLTASLSTDSVDLGDEFTISGTAKGSKQVDILIISPKGAGGTKIDGTSKGMYYASTSVSMMDGTFSKKINAGPNVDTGRYLVTVLSPGADGRYGKVGWNSIAEALNQYTTTARTQDDILEILEDIITLSDDLMWVDYIRVGEIETLTLNPVADVVVGNPLDVTGETSRKDGSIIWITVKGRYYEIVPQAAIVKDNTFKATFDTTGAQPGTYTVKAIDGYGYTAVASVNIIAETLAPTSFDTGEGSYPSIMGTHNGTLTIKRMYTYPCTGTGGHSEYAAFYDQNETKIGEGHWKGYQSGDYHYITFDTPLTLEIGKTYNYTIRTGSYPQIIHNQTHTTENGTITCTKFIDANGKEYNNWIPAIRLE